MQQKSQPLYFVNAWVDWTFIGGLSIAFFLVLTFVFPDIGERQLIVLAVSLLWAGNFPHFFATNYRFYRRLENVRQFPVTGIFLPFLALGAAVLALSYPHLVAPCLVTLYLIWSPYHFSGQTLGLSMVYARRAGFPIGKLQKAALCTFVFGTFAYSFVATAGGARIANPGEQSGSSYLGIPFLDFGFAPWLGTAVAAVMLAGGLVFLWFVTQWSRKEKRLLPPIVLLPAIAQCVWFVLAPKVAPSSFLAFVAFFHSLQYLFVAWATQLKERMSETDAAPSRRFVWAESLKWGIHILLGGFVLFAILPAVFMKVPVFETAMVVGVVYVAIQLHHFFVDGVIWKLRNPKVASPLMVSLADLAGVRAQRSDA